MRLQNSIKLAASLGVLAMAGVSFGQSITFLPLNKAVSDISADGAIAVGSDMGSGMCFYWTADTGVVEIGGWSNCSISDDGTVIVGREFSDVDGKEEAAIWLGGYSWETMGNVPGGESCDNFRSSFWGTSGDGSTSVGLAWVENCRAHAFTYDADNGMVDLGSTVEGRSSRANRVSADASTVIGWQDATDGFRQGASWVDGVQMLYTFEYDGVDYPVGEAQAISADNSVIVGASTPLATGWRWTEADGVVDTGVLSGWMYMGYNFATSGDGSVVGGMSGFGFDRIGHIWTPGTGIQSANDYLAAAGIELPDGYFVMTVTGISEDGQTIAGYGMDGNFALTGFVASTASAPALELTVEPLIAGQSSLLQVDGADAGSKVVLAYSLEGLGETPIPQLDVTLDIASARLLKMGKANSEGHLQYLAPVPAKLGGTEIWLQAAAKGMTSNVDAQVIGN